MRRHTGRRCAKDGMVAVEAVQRVAPAARHALVAARGIVIEIETAGPLHDVAANRRHVADLARSAGNNGARQQWETRSDVAMTGEGGVPHAGADQEAAVVARLDLS